MEFFAAEQIVNPIAENDPLSMEYKAYLVNGSRATLRSFAGGHMLSQVLDGSGFQIWFHDFFMEQAVSILSVSQHPLSVLHYGLEGNIKWKSAKDETYSLQEGQYFLLKIPAKTEQLLFLEPGVSQFFQVDFSASFQDRLPGSVAMEGLLPFGLERINKVASCGLNDYRVKTAISAIQENQITNRVEQDFFLRARIMDLLQLHVHHMAEKSGSLAYAPDQEMEAIQDYILTHLEKPLSTTSLCEQFHITRSVLQRYFKQYTKQSLQAYIRRQRMEYGIFLLQCGDKQVSEIALLTGYEDISGFRKAFKAYFGFRPSNVVPNKD